MYTVTIAILIASCSLVLFFKYFRDKKLPPGPSFCLPIPGNVLYQAWNYYRGKISHHDIQCRWAIRYGKVVSFWFGNQLVVVINDAKLVRETFNTDDIADRPVTASWYHEATVGNGIIFSSGYIWKNQRKFAAGVMRNLGIEKPSFEDVICKEVQELISEFKVKDGSPLNPQELFKKATSNVISSVIFGKRFLYSDESFSNVIKALHRNVEIGSGIVIFPFLKYLPGMSKLIDEYTSNINIGLQFVVEIVEEHKRTFDRGYVRDMIDSFLCEIEEVNNENGDEVHSSAFAENNLVALLLDLFIAGTETVSACLSWFFLYMITHPDIQHKMQHEIDTVVGRDRLPRIADKPGLPYTEAVILEVMRLQTVIPLLTHCAGKDSYVHGYLIPKGAVVFGNVWHMLHDSDIWEDSREFKPERFIDKGGSLNTRSDVMLPFGKGRRVCLGEQISKMELFIFVTHLLHQFNFKLPDRSPPVSFDGVEGINNAPEPYHLVAISRNTELFN